MPLGEVTHAASQLPSLNALPPGVRQTTVGDAEVMEELFASFGLAMLTGVLCIYIVLVLLFKDVLQPVTILAALPLSLPKPMPEPDGLHMPCRFWAVPMLRLVLLAL